MTLLAAAVLLFNGFFNLLELSFAHRCAKIAASELLFHELEFASPSRSFPFEVF